MKINRALKVRIYPNRAQEVQILKTLGSCRFIYNQMLAERIDFYEQNKENKEILKKHKYKTEKQYKESFSFLSEVDSTSLQQSRRDLDNAYKNFFNSISGKRQGKQVGFPKFKKKKSSESFRTVMNIDAQLLKKKIKAPKLGWIKFRHGGIKEWYFEAELKYITFSKSSTGKFFASLLYEGEQDFKGMQEINKGSKIIGLDMSMKNFYVDQEGKSPEFIRRYRSKERKLAKAQKKLSRTKKGSNNREKARKRVARVHEKLQNQRKDFNHKLSAQIVKENDIIVVEDINLQSMSKMFHLGKSVSDLGFGQFRHFLQYKSLWSDKTLIKADKWFASSKTCSHCGYKNKDLTLSEREWSCPNCGAVHHRDQNAGKNLQNYGFEFLGLEKPEVTLVENKTSVLDESREQVCSMKQEDFNKEFD